MNGLYIGIGSTIILALVAALVGPFFVDWGTYRAIFEREATKIVGYRVTVIGEVDARLLPSPRIRFGDVVVGPVEAPFVRVGRFELDLEAAPLLRGDVRVSEMRLERPALDLVVDRDGRLVLPERVVEARDPASVEIDAIEIGDGRVAVTDQRGGGRLEIGRIAAIGSAASLAGPWKLDGGGLRAGRDLSFHFGGGRSADGATALRLQVSPADDPAIVTADLSLRDGPTGPAISGRLTAERRGGAAGDLASALASWRAEAQIAGDARGLEASGLTLSIGPEERAAQFTGEGRAIFGAEPRFDVTLAARQIELDRLASPEPGRIPVPAAVAREALAILARGGDTTLPGRIRVDVQGLVVGGGAVQEVELEARTRPGGLTVDRLAARLPGRSRLDTGGRIVFDGAARFDGRVEIASEQPATLAAWWRAETIGDRLDAMSVSATVSASADRLRADDLRLEVARAKARGHLDWSAAGVRLALAAERLELDQVARLARLFLLGEASRRPASLALELDAGQMVVGGVTAKGVAIGVSVAADDVAIERLTVQDLAGARLAGSGHIADPLGAPRGRLDLTLDAVKPEAPARALATLAGLEPEAIERIATLAGLATPLDLALRLEGTSGAEGTALNGALRGFAGGAEVTSDLTFAGRIDDPARGEVKIATRLAGEKAAPGLVRLFGGGAAAGPLGLDLKVEGRPVDGLTAAVSTRVGATSAGGEGRVWLGGGVPARLEGRLRLATPDATALGALVGRPILAFERRVPVDLTALVAGSWPRLDIGEMAGRIGETGVRGNGRLDLAARPAAIEARLDLDRLDGEAVAEALLGGAVVGDDDKTVFATSPLTGPAHDGALVGTLAVSVGRLDLGAGGFDRVRTRLVLRPGETRLEAIEAGGFGGRIAGEMSLGRSGDGVSALSGRLALTGGRLGDVAWRRLGRPVADGRLDAEASFTASGRTAAALVAGLDGEGRIAITGARVVGLGGEALAATRAALGEVQPTPEAVAAAFRARLDASESEVPATEVAFALQAGVARSGRLVIETASARVTGRVAIDLSHLSLDADGSMEPIGAALEATKTAISRATPSVGFAFRGPIAAPERSLDVTPLVAHLTLSGIEREVERVEALQQDIAERARLARERRRLEEIRAAEEAAKREAEAKRAAEEAAKRAADEAAKREEAAKKAADEPVKRAPAKPAPQPSGGTVSGSTLPPLPPPVIVAPPPPVLEAPAGQPLSIVPPGMGAP